MKKLMILMAAVATSAFALGADPLKNVFDATTASDLSRWGVPAGDGKAVLADQVLTLATGSDTASYWVKDESNPYPMGDNLYFDVSLDLLGQALDEVPTLPRDAKLALFLLDTTDIDGAPAGTNLYALAKHPTETATVLMKLNADVETLTRAGTFTRLTVQTYKNVFKSGQTANSAFVVYQNGGATEGTTVQPVQLDRYYTFKNDGSINWNSPKSVDGSYLSGVLDATVSGKRTCLLLSVKSGVDGQSFTALDFTGNAKIKQVEINDSGFDFIAADVTVTTITLEGVSITVDPASAYDATKGTLSASCKIAVTKNPGMEILTYTPMGSNYLVDDGDGTFTYTYAEGNDVSFTAVAACAMVGDEPYATIGDALTALASAGKGTLKLRRDLVVADLEASGITAGFLDLSGNIILDLAGKNITLPGDESSDKHGVVYLSEGSLKIINTDQNQVGRIKATVEGRPAVCCEVGEVGEDGNRSATIAIEAGIFEGPIRDIFLETADAEANQSAEADGETVIEPTIVKADVVGSITITGGSFSVEPDDRLIAKGYVATQGEDGYWTVAQGEAPAEVSFTLTISDGAKVSAGIEIDGESVETVPKTLKKGQSYKVTFMAANGYQFAGGEQPVFEGTAGADAIVIEAPTVTAIAYGITYSWTGVEVADAEKIENTNPATYTIEDAITFTAPTCEGYTFKGFDIQGIALGETGNKTVTGTFEKSSTPPVVVDPSKEPVVVDSEEAANALTISATSPDASVVPDAEYTGYFKKVVTQTTDGKFSVAAVLDETVVKAEEVAAELVGKFDKITDAGVEVAAKSGLFYSVEQGESLGAMTEGERVMAKGEKVQLKATKYSGSGFYKILVNTSDKTSAK